MKDKYFLGYKEELTFYYVMNDRVLLSKLAEPLHTYRVYSYNIKENSFNWIACYNNRTKEERASINCVEYRTNEFKSLISTATGSSYHGFCTDYFKKIYSFILKPQYKELKEEISNLKTYHCTDSRSFNFTVVLLTKEALNNAIVDPKAILINSSYER